MILRASSSSSGGIGMLTQRFRTNPVTAMITTTHDDRRRTFHQVVSAPPLDERALRIKRLKQQQRGGSKKLYRARSKFVDRVRLACQGGNGGRGNLSVSMIKRRNHFRPDGGHGGMGGSVIVLADPHCTTLAVRSGGINADDGEHGASNACNGGAAPNRLIRVPPGVIVKRILQDDEVWNAETQTITSVFDEPDSEFETVADEEEWLLKQDELTNHEIMHASFQKMKQQMRDAGKVEEEDDDDVDNHNSSRNNNNSINNTDNGDDDESSTEPIFSIEPRQVVTVADLDAPGSHVVVARGGAGGFGNVSFANRHGPLPDGSILLRRAKGRPGEQVVLELELKLIADIGLVGFPNAGKSSLLRAMSKASPDIAPYPFTTLHPLVGVVEYRDGFRLRAADIPGLIAGAAEGRGMGHDFLRHVERTSALLYMVDAAGVDLRHPLDDLTTLVHELERYKDGSLVLERRALVVANKVDLLHPEAIPEVVAALQETATSLGIQLERDVLPISAGVTGEGLGVLSKAMREIVMKAEKEKQEAFLEEILDPQPQQDQQRHATESA